MAVVALPRALVCEGAWRVQTVAHTFLDLASRHYPERLGTFYLIDAPSIFNVLYSALMPFIDPATRSKIRLIPCAPAHNPSPFVCSIYGFSNLQSLLPCAAAPSLGSLQMQVAFMDTACQRQAAVSPGVQVRRG